MATAHIIHAFLGFTSTRLGSEVSCPRTLPRKNPEDLVRLEPRTPGLRVKHLTTEPRGTLNPEGKQSLKIWKEKKPTPFPTMSDTLLETVKNVICSSPMFNALPDNKF